MDQLLVLLALHGGVVSTTGLGGDSLPDELTPGVDVEAQVEPIPWLSIGPAVKYLHYTQSGFDGDAANAAFTDANTQLSVGGRVQLHPIPQVLVGFGLFELWDRDDNAEHGKTTIGWDRAISPEISVGASVGIAGNYRFQMIGSLDWADVGISLYQISLLIGVERIFHAVHY